MATLFQFLVKLKYALLKDYVVWNCKEHNALNCRFMLTHSASIFRIPQYRIMAIPSTHTATLWQINVSVAVDTDPDVGWSSSWRPVRSGQFAGGPLDVATSSLSCRAAAHRSTRVWRPHPVGMLLATDRPLLATVHRTIDDSAAAGTAAASVDIRRSLHRLRSRHLPKDG